MTKAKPAPKESSSYQSMLEEVEGIVRTVSSGPMDLDDVVAKVEQGYKLIRQMRERLDTTKAKVEELRTEFESDIISSKGQSGSPTSQNSTSSAAKDVDDEDTPF